MGLTCEDVIESIGMGPAQIFWALLGGGIWLADGAELLLVSSVTRRPLAEDLCGTSGKRCVFFWLKVGLEAEVCFSCSLLWSWARLV